MNHHFEYQKNIKASGYTIITVAFILMLLFVIRWQIGMPQEPLLNEGIEVNLGNSETGLGDIPPMIPGEPAPEAGQQTAAAPPASSAPPEPLATEEDNDEPDAPAVPKKVEPTPAKPKAQQQPQPEVARKTTQQPPAPPQPKPKATMGSYSGGQGTGGNNQDAFNNAKNQGIAGGTGDQGKPNGNINSDNYTGNGGTGKSGVAITRGLSGRRITRLPSFEDDFNENAKIAVDIKVDENGSVVSAVYQSRGSTSSSSTLKAIAIRKAMQLKFNPGETESLGTVVFNFRLKE
jgi:hypothetical protein